MGTNIFLEKDRKCLFRRNSNPDDFNDPIFELSYTTYFPASVPAAFRLSVHLIEFFVRIKFSSPWHCSLLLQLGPLVLLYATAGGLSCRGVVSTLRTLYLGFEFCIFVTVVPLSAECRVRILLLPFLQARLLCTCCNSITVRLVSVHTTCKAFIVDFWGHWPRNMTFVHNSKY